MKKKQKQKSIILFILGLLLTAALIFVNIFGVTINGKEKGSARNIVLGLDLKGGVSVTYQAVGDYTEDDLTDTIKKLQLRAQEFSTESDVYREGENRITVDIPGEDNAEEVLEKLGKPGSLSFVTDFGTDNAKTWLSGADVDDATPQTTKDQTTGSSEYVVSFKLKEEGAAKFAEATTKFVGKPIYVIYDGNVISSPYVENPITGGAGVINGMKSYEEAEELASLIRIGSLKVELESLSSKVVSPKLGDDALSTSVFAGAVGMAIIIIFMIWVYRVPGFAASLALIIYTALDLICINGFNMTLTLPGIAGVILSIGMAVDANVIIYARIKEELAESDDVQRAIKIGFQKATSAIVDGNVTTFIAAMILMVVGTGTIRGFAQTLAIGIVLSMFTAMVISRIIINLLYRMGFDKSFMYGVQKERKTFDFLGKKVYCYILSSVVILAAVVVMILSATGKIDDRKNALNYSVEFQGGLSTTVEFKEKYDISYFNDNIQPAIAKAIGDTDILANAETDSNKFIIRTKLIDTEEKEAMKKMLTDEYGAVAFDELSVSATTSSDMRKDAVIAVVIAAVCMLIYIFIRFKDMKFATSAIIALIHDVFIVIAFYALSWSTVGNTFIACILTILGYSINATIVIFDRIRENISISGKDIDRKELVNASITQTMTRTIYTTFTTAVMVLTLYIFGVTAIKEFALPLLIGIVAGAYASVFITGALWYIMGGKKAKLKETI